MNVKTSAHFTWCIQIGISWLSMANNRNTNCSGWCKVWYVYSWICQGGFRIVFAILFLAFFSAGITHWHLINKDVLTNTCKQFLSWRMPINMPISCPIYPHPLLKKKTISLCRSCVLNESQMEVYTLWMNEHYEKGLGFCSHCEKEDSY